MDQEETAAAVWELLGYAVEGRSTQAAETLQRIGTSVDGNRMYGVCCAIAEAGKAALKKQFAPAAFAGPSSVLYGIHQLGPGTDPPDMWAARFLVAYANNDKANTLALFETAIHASDDDYTDSVCALVTTVAGVIVCATGGTGR